MPGDKKEFIKDTSVELPAVGSYINRQLARVAGILMSLSAAVNMAPLDLRLLYQSMGENMSSTADDGNVPGSEGNHGQTAKHRQYCVNVAR